MSDDVPYFRIIAKVAERLKMTVGEVDAVMTAYEQESRADREERSKALADNPVYQQWKAAKAKREG